jgi:hypothetical protein
MGILFIFGNSSSRMTFSVKTYILIAIFTFRVFIGKSQDAPIGYWESLLPYNTAVGVCTDGNKLYVACKQAFFTCNSLTGEFEKYSKAEGMSDIGMKGIAYDMATSSALLVYTNGDIDVFSNSTFYNIPDLKLKSINTNKVVNDIYTENGKAYVSSTIGIVVVDMAAHNVNNAHQFISPSSEVIPVSSFGGTGNYFYAATDAGIYRASKNNFDQWSLIGKADSINRIARVSDKLFFASARTIFVLSADTLLPVYHSQTSIQYICPDNNNLFIGVTSASGGAMKIMNLQYLITDSFDCSDSTTQAVRTLDGTVWVSAANTGLRKRTETNHTDVFIPEGPSSALNFDVYAYNRNVYIAHGAYTDNFYANGSFNGISYYHDGVWKLYKRGTYAGAQNMQDINCLVKDETRNILYAGSYLGGLLMIADTGYQVIGKNSIFDGSIAYGQDAHQVVGLGFDSHRNLWVTEMFSPKHELYAKTPDDTWYKYSVPGVEWAGPLAIDDNDQVWIVGYSGGASVFNYNGTIGDSSDDKSYHFIAGKGYGNLPSSHVFCIVKDRNNDMWIGTNSGIGVVKGCTAPFAAGSCDATIPQVTSGPYAGNPFVTENIKTIAVDAINNKWVGTDGGVWQLSEDGSAVLNRFTASNSPLPSNHIEKITIDKVTGDVYIGTDQGLVSYHAPVAEGAANLQHMAIFPNPVPPGYGGYIAINGLVDNADVRITDISGQLVYKARAHGGQVVWNGADYTGHRPQSGVYLVFAANSAGTQTVTGKIVFLQ